MIIIRKKRFLFISYISIVLSINMPSFIEAAHIKEFTSRYRFDEDIKKDFYNSSNKAETLARKTKDLIQTLNDLKKFSDEYPLIKETSDSNLPWKTILTKLTKLILNSGYYDSQLIKNINEQIDRIGIDIRNLFNRLKRIITLQYQEDNIEEKDIIGSVTAVVNIANEITTKMKITSNNMENVIKNNMGYGTHAINNYIDEILYNLNSTQRFINDVITSLNLDNLQLQQERAQKQQKQREREQQAQQQREQTTATIPRILQLKGLMSPQGMRRQKEMAKLLSPQQTTSGQKQQGAQQQQGLAEAQQQRDQERIQDRERSEQEPLRQGTQQQQGLAAAQEQRKQQQREQQAQAERNATLWSRFNQNIHNRLPEKLQRYIPQSAAGALGLGAAGLGGLGLWYYYNRLKKPSFVRRNPYLY